MENPRKQKMTRGAILFAFNSPKFNYYSMAEFTAKRINHFLNLPVTLVTDENSLPDNPNYNFDNIILVDPDKSNRRDWGMWINKGRYQAYQLSPYDETLLLDVDYVVNSGKLLKAFDICEDFICHDNTEFLMQPKLPQEILSAYSYKTLWATAVIFKKTNKAKQIFECLEMVQKNFDHYANIHSFVSFTFRNDYALTLAVNIVNGHTKDKKDVMPWNLVHIGKNTKVYKNTNDVLDVEYTIMFDHWKNGKIKKEYMLIKDMDFHMMNKENFMEIVNG
jgi:hypothetical protein